MKRNVLTLFLASPSDLEAEREIVQKTVLRVNTTTGKIAGWSIDLQRWEESTPGYGRPQSRINPGVDSCDLFLGMLWRRWGQPTGKYTSGFEEEFCRALDRKKTTAKPEIWLFFKAVDESYIDDAGPQLSKVLEFKKKLIQKNILQFQEFKDTDKWKDRICDLLSMYIIRLARKQPQPTIPEQSLVVEKNKLIAHEEIQDLGIIKSYPQQIVGLFKKLYEQVAKEGSKILDFSERTRLMLLTNSWFSEKHTGEILGIHKANVAYLQRKTWELSEEELIMLFRSSIGEKSGLIACWYWFRDWSSTEINSLLCQLAIRDVNPSVRSGAFSLLENIGYRPSKALFKKGLQDNNETVINQVIRLLQVNKNKETLDLLETFYHSENIMIRKAANLAKIKIMFLENPNRAFEETINYSSNLTNEVINSIDWMNTNLDSELLLEAMDNNETYMRIFSMRYMRNKKMLSKETCGRFVRDPDNNVKREALLGFLDLGEDFDTEKIKRIFPFIILFDEGQLIYRFTKLRDPQKLLSSIYWYNKDGYYAYRALAIEHFNLIKHRLRSDLEDKFETLRLESENQMSERIGKDEMLKIIWWKEESSQEFYRAMYVSASLAGLVKNGQPEDVRFARELLGKTHYNLADIDAIKLLERFGDSSDVENIIKSAKSSKLFFTETENLAIEVALKLSSDIEIERFISNAINNDDISIIKIAINYLSKIPRLKRIQLTKRLLKINDSDLRLKALSLIAQECDRQDLEKMLDDYLQMDTYYFNVVTWLDQYLYAPGRYGEFFQDKLNSLIQE